LFAFTLRAMNAHRPALAAETLAIVLLGLMAGFFFAFAVDVAPAMRGLDAQGYIATQQAINKSVRNASFAFVYFGSALLPFITAGLLLMAKQRRAWAWLVVAVIYAAGVFLLTRQINVPINDALALWNPLAPPADWQAARDTWNDANLVRAIVAAACFAAAVMLRPR
jgi:uncharacterized membrane protein